ncbi:Uncharacterized protein QTN25_001172 [Entamoeba marina]
MSGKLASEQIESVPKANRLVLAKANAFHVMNKLNIDKLKGNYISVIASGITLLVSLYLTSTQYQKLSFVLVFIATILFHVQVLSLQTSEYSLPISTYLNYVLTFVQQPHSVVYNQILSFFKGVVGQIPQINSYFTTWVAELYKINVPAILLFVIAFGLMKNKTQVMTRLILPFMVTLIVGTPVTFNFISVGHTALVSIGLLILTSIFVTCFFNGLIELESIVLSPIYFIAIVFTSQDLSALISSLFVLDSLTTDIVFVVSYLLMFYLVFYKRMGNSLLPPLLLAVGVSMLTEATTSVEYLLPAYFLLHSISD